VVIIVQKTNINKNIKHKGVIMEEQSLENICKYRCIQIEDYDNPPCVDYHKVIQEQEQEDLNGQYLVDYIIGKRFFPNGVWV